MARASRWLFLCGCALSATMVLAAPPEPGVLDPQAKILTALEVQKAFEMGKEYLSRGEYRNAVETLESKVHLIDGSRRYVEALRDAYIGYIGELKKANKTADIARYQERLEVIDPGSRLVRGTNAPSVVAFNQEKPQPQTPVTLPPASPNNPPKLPSVATTPTPERTSVAAVAPPPPAAGQPEVIVARGKAEDIFADRNSRENHQARALIEKADDAFRAGRYDEAGMLYAQAHRLAPAECSAVSNQWAYCKLFAVGQALNAPGTKLQPPQELEKEVRVAMSLAPTLEREGQKLLREIQTRQPAGLARKTELTESASLTITVHHTPRGQGQKYAIAETTNFRIYHNQKPEFAERVARIVEETKVAASRKWFGDDGGTWTPRCDIYLHATGPDYAEATKTPATSPGHSTINRARDSDKIINRGIDVHCDNPNMLTAVLPHETTHIVLAGRLGAHDVPRWADEGMAVLSEPRERIDRHLKNLPTFSQNRQLFPCGQLIQLNDYPDVRYIGSFYAQSVSLVEFLSNRKGTLVFARFLREGMDGNYEAALRKHYDIAGFKELEALWRQAAFAEGGAVAAR